VICPFEWGFKSGNWGKEQVVACVSVQIMLRNSIASVLLQT
jgi:hypothetical protein